MTPPDGPTDGPPDGPTDGPERPSREPPPVPPAATSGPVPWDLVIQLLGLGAALAAWVAVVGGGKVWARFESAGIPTTQTLAGLPRELMITEGLQTLLVPVLLGAGAALLFLTVVPREPAERVASQEAEKGVSPRGANNRVAARYVSESTAWLAALGGLGLILTLAAIAEVDPLVPLLTFGVACIIAIAGVLRRRKAIVVASVIVALAGVILAIILAVEGWALLVMLALTVLGVPVTIVFVQRARRRGDVALTLFAAFVLWAGALGYVQEAGDRTPQLDHAAVTLKDGRYERGYFLGRSSDRLYLAQNRGEVDEGDDPVRHVLVLNSDDIDRVVYGSGATLPEEGGPGTGARQTGPGPDAPPERGRGGGGGGGDTKGGGTEPDPPEPGALPFPSPTDSGPGKIDGVRVELRVLALEQRDDLFELDAQLVNVSNVRGPRRSLRVADALDDGDPANEAFTVDKIRLVESARRELYPVMYDDEGHCACTQRLDRAVLKPGQTWRLWATFPAPQPRVTRVHLSAPGFGWIPDVDVG
jgi:hypothetical protein